MGNFIKLINGEKPVLADFFATWCGPCNTMSPILIETKSKLEDKITIVKIDVDKNQDAAGKFNVRGVPTLILFKNGEVIWRKSGVLSSDQLIGEIQEFLN
jgi:thioredoxin 1|tara:strand:+ start:143 stop:442 length:300 start_codon:yes stop_codon:yes gene_type:complete